MTGLHKLIKPGSYIDGQWSSEGVRFAVYNPANGDIVASLVAAGTAEAEHAITAAKRAQETWQQVPAPERARILRRWYDLILQHQNELAQLLTLEQGKPLAEAKSEIAYGAGFVEWYAEEAKRIYGDTIPAAHKQQRIMVLKQAVGVVAAITPWNFPNAMITRKVAPALAAGCSVVLKPASATPLSALALASLAEQAGLPHGLFNVLVSDQATTIGEVLTRHPDVRKFSFTGSTETGKQLAAQCASSVKTVSLELGGNAPFIVFADADLDAAVEGAIASKFRNAGQTCICSNRFLVQESVADAFVARLGQRVAALKVGNGMEADVEIGPLINLEAAQKVADKVAEAIAAGAKALSWIEYKTSSPFYPPTILTGVTPAMALVQEEIFGPVAPIITFKDEQEALRIANDTPYGLAAYVYTRDLARSWRVTEGLEYGMVGLNEGAISNPAAPFGGVKQSGYGREGAYYGLEDYLQVKYVCVGGLDTP